MRPDGSLVQVTLGDSLELRGFDEEFGPGHTPGPDELRGAARARAIEAAYAHVGPGRVLGVERETSREIDVDMRMGTDRIEVQLNPRFRAIGVKPEDPRDDQARPSGYRLLIVMSRKASVGAPVRALR